MVLKRQFFFFFPFLYKAQWSGNIQQHCRTVNSELMKDTMAKNPKLIQKHGFLFFLRQRSGFNGNAALDSWLLVEITQLKVFSAPQSTEGIPAARGGAEQAGFLLLSGRSPREKLRVYLSVAFHPCSPHGLFPSYCLLLAPEAYLQAYSAPQSLWPACRRMPATCPQPPAAPHQSQQHLYANIQMSEGKQQLTEQLLCGLCKETGGSPWVLHTLPVRMLPFPEYAQQSWCRTDSTGKICEESKDLLLGSQACPFLVYF